VVAGDIKFPSNMKLLNPEMYITEIDKDGLELTIDIRIEKGAGYMSVEELKKREDDVNVLIIDANFSPVVNVQYEVLPHRVGDITNLDELEMVIKTNGVMLPQDVLRFSSNMLKSYFELFNEEGLQIEGEFI
jgi:DNA-directed RNA polymerase subunit alpha